MYITHTATMQENNETLAPNPRDWGNCHCCYNPDGTLRLPWQEKRVPLTDAQLAAEAECSLIPPEEISKILAEARVALMASVEMDAVPAAPVISDE